MGEVREGMEVHLSWVRPSIERTICAKYVYRGEKHMI